MATNTSLFSDFTNMYSLTKTLRFELKPTEPTKLLLQKTNNMGLTPVQIDIEIDRLYHEEMKPMFDEMHLRFITESLERVEFDIEDLGKFEETYLAIKQLSKNRKENQQQIQVAENLLSDISAKLRKQVTQTYSTTAEEWKQKYPSIRLKKSNYEILTEKDSLLLLKEFFPEKAEIIDKFIGFHTYFTGFNQNRENYYKNEGKATEIAFRIVNQNLVRFIENREAIKKIREAGCPIENTEVFDLENYQNLLTQAKIDEFNERVVGSINLQVNLYSQQNKIKLPKLKILYKQIGSKKKSVELFQIIAGKEWEELENLIQNQNIYLPFVKASFEKFFENPEDYDLDQIYFNKASLNTISNRWFGGWFVLAEKLRKDKAFGGKVGDVSLKDISLAQIKQALENLEGETVESLFKSGHKGQPEIYKQECFVENNFWQTFLNIWKLEISQNFALVEQKITEFETKKQETFDKKTHGKWLKEICDSFLSMERMIKYNKRKEEGGDSRFYEFIDLHLDNSELVKYYNAFRNYISQKPFETDKIKLNFENGSLLGGWSDGQEKVKAGVILKNKDKIYLGIIQDRGFFRTDKPNKIYQTENSNWQRLILTNLKFQTLAGKGFLGKYGQRYGDLGKTDPLRAMVLLQEFIRENYLQKYPQLETVASKTYTDKRTFDAEVKLALEDCFTMKFVPIREDFLQEGLEQEKLFLFEITNKDLASSSQGKKNIHTEYWQILFSPENIKNPLLVLNGQAEVFWRQGQKEKLEKKYDKKGKEVLDAKRYAEDKFFFHVPITINYGKPKVLKFKDKVQDFIQKNKENLTYLGIDRGEKYLLYYSLLDSQGNILKQGSFDKIQMDDKTIDFNEKLSSRAKDMMEARQNWQTIGNIKNFKEGYLSQVVHEIYQVVIENNALIIMEDLNTEFKAKRTARVEKSVYKKFELQLARKLNHLVLKDRKPDEEGGVLKAYQLTPYIEAGKVENFEKAKEWGIIKYVKAAYTSTTDPVTGWRKRKYISNSAEIAKIKEFFNVDTGVQIDWDEQQQCFKFSYNWESEENGEKKSGFDELFAFKVLERFRWIPKYENSETNTSGEIVKYDLYEEFANLFMGLDKTQNINQQITELDNFNWKSLAFLWNLLNQIRNTDKNGLDDNKDFIQSPVLCSQKTCILPGLKTQNFEPFFFDSRKVKDYAAKFGVILPENGDANGAYHIAKSGLDLILKSA